MYIVTRLVSDVHFHITGPELTFKTYNYRHCDTSMSPKTADYFPSGGVIATMLGNCKVLCYANMNVTLLRASANQNSVFSITQQSRLLFRIEVLFYSDIKCNGSSVHLMNREALLKDLRVARVHLISNDSEKGTSVLIFIFIHKIYPQNLYRQTDVQSDKPRTKWSLCAAMLRTKMATKLKRC